MIDKEIYNNCEWTLCLRNAQGVPGEEQALEMIGCDSSTLRLILPKVGIMVVFGTTVKRNYVAFRLKEIKGEACRNIYDIKVVVKNMDRLRAVPIDYMSRCNDLNITQSLKEDLYMEDLANETGVKENYVIAEIPFLWVRTSVDSMGGFVFYQGENDEEEEDVFYRIWVDENLPHPFIEGKWTIQRAKDWVREWKEKCGTYSEMYILPHGPEDLKPLAREVRKFGVKNVYLHCDVWRGAFWPMDTEIFHINEKIFPHGAEDLKAYSEYLRSEGLGLVTRIVSGSIGPEHPRYMKGRPDDGISTWLRCRLGEDIDCGTTELIVDIDPGQDTWSGYWDESPTMELKTVSIGHELIKIGRIIRTSPNRWCLADCERGVFHSTVHEHKAEASVRILKSSYGFVFVADPHHRLFHEILEDYVNFINGNHLAVVNFDGLEIHRVDPYGANLFLEEVYKRIDHPVRSNTSGGIPRWGFFQYRLPSVQKMTGRDRPLFYKHQLGLFKIGLYEERWEASGPYDYTYAYVPEVVQGGPCCIQANRGFHNIELNDLRKHGLIDLYQREFVDWGRIGRMLPDSLKQRIRDSQYRRNTPLGPEPWPCSDEQFRFRRDEDGEVRAVEPFQVLKRDKVDRPFCMGQEFGLVSPRQYVKSGARMTLRNPYSAQEPEFIIRNMFSFDYARRKGMLYIAPESEAEAKFHEMLDLFQGASLVTIEDDGRKSFIGTVDYDIQPKVNHIVNCGETRFLQQENWIRMSLVNSLDKDLLQVSWTNDTLPRYPVLSSIDKAGGLFLKVDGDGSGAILVIRVISCGTRDFVVPIDFIGEKTIEIPSPECCYSEGRWRWMPAYKRLRGGPVTEIRLGFAMVPKHTTASVAISEMHFLPEKESELLNPAIAVGEGYLRISGRIPSGRYLWYKGGDTIGIYDLNWQKVEELPVEKNGFIMQTGENEIGLSHQGKEQVWLECQFITSDSSKGNRL